ncbi:MAG: pyruvate dehydrogenase (acetyl-transferring), homodimeric type [Acidimicrobiales bacterium]
MIIDGFSLQVPDIDPAETTEWVESFDQVIDQRGRGRARYLALKLLERSRERQVGLPAMVSTDYINSIPPEREPWFPGDDLMERRIRAFIRWNAVTMVTRANLIAPGIGGHLATYASSASLYEVGFNHFFRGKDDLGDHPGVSAGDQVFFQGHAAPGIYARAYLEGRLNEDQLDHFRMEMGGKGLSSYPHPRLMPDFWEFPTVSMGLGPINAIYQARFNRYLANRSIVDTSGSRVWCFAGDGECDEPETLGALSLAAREQLDNLTFVVNCNLQRLDGPVRGNGKIIQELEAVFRGAGWNVIKVIWGAKWDDLLARDTDGVLLNKMNTTVDGQYQKYSVESGEYIRRHFFGSDPRLARMVEHLSDDELRTLPRGGHDYHKLYAAYAAATEHRGAPTAILAKTIKGWTLGTEVEARNATHQIKKMSRADVRVFRDRLGLADVIDDAALEADLPPYCRPPEGSPEHVYMMERRRHLGGSLPCRRVLPVRIGPPAPKAFAGLVQGSAGQEVSTTMAFARLLRELLRDPVIGQRVVPIIPDEARTFGMDSLFPEVKIYAPFGQLYDPVDSHLILSYAESQKGQILEEGITEAGSMASFTAAGTAYATHATPMVPFFVFYSMFGFQRVGDLIWAFGDSRGRGFLCGATAGRTTLNGEGLQHADGHSLLLASTVPNLAAYDPAFAYELGVIISDGITRMFGDGSDRAPEDVFYYVTLYNENYLMPPQPADPPQGPSVAEGIRRGIYRFSAAPDPSTGDGEGRTDSEAGSGAGGKARRSGGDRRPASILFSGPAQGAARQAAQILADDHGVAADLWSVTSYKALREDALEVERWNRLHPGQPARVPYVTEALAGCSGPTVAVTDYMKMVPDQVARWVPGPFVPLGTDGWGRSDTRASLRRHFETDAASVVVAVLSALAQSGDAKPEEVAEAMARHQVSDV